MKRETPAAKALIGALALADGSTTNQAFKLAGYSLKGASPVAFGNYNTFRGAADMRLVIRDGRIVYRSRNAHKASYWLARLGQKLAALGVGRERAA